MDLSIYFFFTDQTMYLFMFFLMLPMVITNEQTLRMFHLACIMEQIQISPVHSNGCYFIQNSEAPYEYEMVRELKI